MANYFWLFIYDYAASFQAKFLLYDTETWI